MTVMWDIEPETYPEIASSIDKIVKHVVDNVKPGSIILLHPMYDGKGNTINAIKDIVTELKKKGYVFKTVCELIAAGK